MKKLILFMLVAGSVLFLLNCDSDVKEEEGQAVFWTMQYMFGNYPGPKTIFVEDVNIGTTSTGYSVAPTCTASGCVIFKAKPGTYNWKAVDVAIPNAYKTGTLTISVGGCTPVDCTI